jgi:large subunit ribosomal protein L3
MGGTVRTALNRRIVAIDAENNLLMIDGSVPGARNNVVLIRTA